MLSSMIPLVDIRRYPNLPWSKAGLSCNHTLTLDDVHHLQVKNGEWDWYGISCRVPLVDIRRYPDLPWSKGGLSWNHTLTVDDIEYSFEIDREWDFSSYTDEKWNWLAISSVISLSEVRKNPNLPWNKKGLSLNPTLTVHDIQSLSIKDGKWDWINIQSRVPIIDVYTHPNLTWNRGRLSANKNIRISDLIAWHEIPPSIYKRWQYPTDVVIV